MLTGLCLVFVVSAIVTIVILVMYAAYNMLK